MRKRPKMQGFDWFHGAALAAVGLFLGFALEGMARLAMAGSWLGIIGILVPFAGFLVFYVFLERITEFISTGRFFLPKQSVKEHKPLGVLFSLPLGILIGVVGAQFGLQDMLL